MRIRRTICAVFLVAAACVVSAGTAMASGEPAAPPGQCDIIVDPASCPGHPNAGRGNGSEFLGTKIDQDPGASAGVNNGGD